MKKKQAAPAVPAPQPPKPKARQLGAFGGAAAPQPAPPAAPKAKAKPKLSPEQIEQGIAALKERVREWGANDYVDEDNDFDGIDDEVLMELSARQEADPENFTLLDQETLEKIEARDARLDALREQELVKRGIPEGRREPVSFEEAISAQLRHHSESIGMKPPPPVVAASAKHAATPGSGPAKRAAPPLSVPLGYSKPRENLMIYRDPEEDARPDRLAGRKPMPLSKIDRDALPLAPDHLLPDKAILGHSAVQQVLSILQKYQIRAGRDLFFEADIEEVFCRKMAHHVSDLYERRKTSTCIMCVFFITTPIFVHCKFKRRPDAERKRRSFEHPIYSWEGYAFTVTQSDEDEEQQQQQQHLREAVAVPTKVDESAWI